HDTTANAAGFRIPTYAIADFECLCHSLILQSIMHHGAWDNLLELRWIASHPLTINFAQVIGNSWSNCPVGSATEFAGGERLDGCSIQFCEPRQQPRFGLPEAEPSDGNRRRLKLRLMAD